MRSFFVAALVLWPLGAIAQHNHQQHHPVYQNWVNKHDKGCCNNQDCGELRDEDERANGEAVEVRIEGQWCPVQSWHYLKRGNAPDWSTSHICVQRHFGGTKTSACDRLLCYQPKPG